MIYFRRNPFTLILHKSPIERIEVNRSKSIKFNQPKPVEAALKVNEQFLFLLNFIFIRFEMLNVTELHQQML